MELIACPACGGEFALEGEAPANGNLVAGTLRCASCRASYPLELGIPRLMPREAPASRWSEWEEKQELGLKEYEELEASAETPFEDVAREFAEFCALDGTILDVGCGISPSLPYANPLPGRLYVGVDPLGAQIVRTYEFVEGVGERLPFRDGVFDTVVAATSLDHFAAPETVLGEIRRVLKPSGRLAVWLGVLDPTYFERMYAMPSLGESEVRQVLAQRLRTFDVRSLADATWRHLVANRLAGIAMRLQRLLGRPLPVQRVFSERSRYHFQFYTEPEVCELLEATGFRVVDKKLLKRPSGDSLFVLGSPSRSGDR